MLGALDCKPYSVMLSTRNMQPFLAQAIQLSTIQRSSAWQFPAHLRSNLALHVGMNQTPADRSQPRECGPAAPVDAQASAAQVAGAARPKGAKVCVYKMDRGCTHWAYRKCKSCTRPLCRTCLSFFHWPTQSCGRKCKRPDRSRTRWARNVLRPRG